MTKNLPTLFGLSIDNISDKISFLKSINLENIVVNDTRQLIQSVDLTYAKYCYFMDNDVEININNYKLLFSNNDKFLIKIGLTKKQLLDRYPYKKENSKILIRHRF